MRNIVISGTGLWVAPEVITNRELVASYNVYTRRYNARHAKVIAVGGPTALAEPSAGFIRKASGIRQRYVIDKADVLDPTRMRPRLTPRPDDALSLQAEIDVAAAHGASAAAGRDAAEVDMLLYATLDFQRPYPALGVEIRDGVGAGGYAFDTNVVCSSTTFGLEQTINAVRSGTMRAALVVSPEITPGHLDWRDRDCHFIFGDVCMAALVEHAENTRSADAWHVLGTKCATSFSNSIRGNTGYLSHNEDRNPDDHNQLFRQKGRRVFKEVCPMTTKHIAGHPQQFGHVPTDVHRFWLYQANLATNQLVGKRLLGHDASTDEAPMILDGFANTASAGSIIAFHHHRADLKSGDLGVICSFGAGYSIGSVTVQKQ